MLCDYTTIWFLVNFKAISNLSEVTNTLETNKWGKVKTLLVYLGWSGKACQIKGYLSRNLNEWASEPWISGWRAVQREETVQDPEVGAHLHAQGRAKKSVLKGGRTGEENGLTGGYKGLCVKARSATLGTQWVLSKWELWLLSLLFLFLSWRHQAPCFWAQEPWFTFACP